LAALGSLDRAAGFALAVGFAGSAFRLAVVAGDWAVAGMAVRRAGALPSGVGRMVVEFRGIAVVTDLEAQGVVVRS
jgi:hypothetical protein